MTAIAIATLSTPSFQSIDPALLDDVAGGIDLGRMVNTGNANAATSGVIAGSPTMASGSVHGGTVGAPSATSSGRLGGGVLDPWNPVRGR